LIVIFPQFPTYLLYRNQPTIAPPITSHAELMRNQKSMTALITAKAIVLISTSAAPGASAKRVAPGSMQYAPSGVKGRSMCSITPLQGWVRLVRVPGATRFALALAFILRAVGASTPRAFGVHYPIPTTF